MKKNWNNILIAALCVLVVMLISLAFFPEVVKNPGIIYILGLGGLLAVVVSMAYAGRHTTFYVLFVFLVAGTASAGDSTFNWLTKSAEQKPAVRYGLGTPCVISTSYHGATVVVEDGEVVNLLVLSRDGKVAGSSRNRGTNVVQAIERSSSVMKKACGDTLLLLPLQEREAIKPFLLAEK